MLWIWEKEQKAWISHLESFLKEKGARISRLEASLKKKGVKISKVEGCLKEKDIRISDLETKKDQPSSVTRIEEIRKKDAQITSF